MAKEREEDEEDGRTWKHVADVIGPWGPIQWQIFIIAVSVYMIAPYQNLSIVLYSPKVDFWCHVPADESNQIEWRTNETLNVCEVSNVTCDRVEFDQSFYKRTLTSEFDLVCDRSWFGSIAQSLHQVGYGISGIAFGFISDNYGRRTSLLLAMTLEIVTGFIQAFTTSTTIWLVSRVFFGASAYGRFLNFYVLMMEWVGPDLRAPAGILSELGYSFGYITLPWVFKAILDYRILQASVTSLEVFALIVVFFFIPESPRWQLTHNDYERAEESLTRAARRKGKYNKDEIAERIRQVRGHLQQQVESEKNNQQNIIGVWKKPALLKISLLLYYSWFSQAFVYYGSVFNLGSLDEDVFVNLTIFGTSYLCSTIFTYLFIAKLGRRRLMYSMFLVESIAFAGLVACYTFDSARWIKAILAFIAAFACGSGFNVIYLYTAETFPTTSRQSSVGTCSVFGRVGSVLSPFTRQLSEATNFSVSLGIFCILSLGTAIVCVFLPDTDGKELADTVGQKETDLELSKLKKNVQPQDVR